MSAETPADIDPRLLQAPEAATQRASSAPCSTFSPIPHCFACPPSCQGQYTGPSSLLDGHSPRPSTSSNVHPLDFFVAYNMAEHSPFAQLKATVEDPAELTSNLKAGRCTSPDTVFPSSHVEKVMLPRVQAIIASNYRPPGEAAAVGSPDSNSPNAPGAENGDPFYSENQQVDELMHVIQLHTSNCFSMKEYAVPLADELRTLLRITASSAASLGTAPDATARPKQFVCACLIRANLLFLLADHLFRAYAALDPETGFGLPNAPTTGTADAAAVREAEGLLRDSLRLHDLATEAVSGRRAASDGAPQAAATRQASSPPLGSSISETDEGLRSVRHVQPRSKVMLRYALVQAALGKRQQAVETLMTTAQMDPWLPELELRPPAVSHAHRVSVEQAKVGLVWYFNSCHDAIRANKYRDDAFFWRIRRLNQEASTWEPADLLPGRAAAGSAAAAVMEPPEVLGGREVRPAPSLPMALPRADSQCGSASAEEHVAKLVLEAREADDKDLAIGILGRAVEHAAATADPASVIVVEPLIEYCYHIVCAPSPASSTSFTTAVHLLLFALRTLRSRDATSAGSPASVPAAEQADPAARRLRLRTRALHALAVALHQTNRVRDPLLMHRRALALVLRSCSDEASMWTLEPRVHIAVLSIVRLFMLSFSGQQHLTAAADRSDCPEGAWKTTYGRGRPGRARRFFQPVVHRDNAEEARQVSGWLCQQLKAGIRILAKHMLGVATAAVEKLRNPPAPTPMPAPAICGVSPLCSTASGVCTSTLRSIEETASMHSQWGGDTSDLNVDSVMTDIAAGDALGDDSLLDTAELPGAGARLQHGRGIFRCVSQKARTQLVDRGSAATAAVGASAAEAIPDVSCSELVDCLERTCEEASSLAREAQMSGFAVRMPPWISRLCIPHWTIALTLLSHLDVAHPHDGGAAAKLPDLTAALHRVLDIFSEFFPASGGDAAADSFDSDTADAMLSYALKGSSGSAASSAGIDGPAAARPRCTSPLTSAQPVQTPAAHLSKSAPVLPASTFDDASPASVDLSALLCVSLEHFPVNDSSAFESAQFERIMSDVVDVGPQQGFSAEPFPECYRCFLDPPLFLHASDSSSLAGSATFTEPPPDASPRVVPAASPSLARLRPSPLSVPSPTSYTAPASQLLLPSVAPSLAENLPKPSVESFGLEPDEVTAISLGPTPIPSLLAMCRSPSRRTTPGPAADASMRIDSSTDSSSFGDASGSHPASPAGADGSAGDDGMGPPVPSPFAGTALFGARDAGDSGGSSPPQSDVPPMSPSPPPPCRSPEPISARSPVDDVGIPFSTLFAPMQPSESADSAGCGANAAGGGDRDTRCSIFGSGGTARMMTQSPEPSFCCGMGASGPWGDAGPSLIAAHSSWHTPAYERGSVMLSEGEGSGGLSDDSGLCVSGACPASSACCCVVLRCSDASSAGSTDRSAVAGGKPRDVLGHRRTASVPAASLSVSSRQLPMTPDMPCGDGSDGDSVSLVPPEAMHAGARGPSTEPLDTMPCSLAPRSAEAAWGGGLWGREGPSGMASRRARSICLDNLNL